MWCRSTAPDEFEDFDNLADATEIARVINVRSRLISIDPPPDSGAPMPDIPIPPNVREPNFSWYRLNFPGIADKLGKGETVAKNSQALVKVRDEYLTAARTLMDTDATPVKPADVSGADQPLKDATNAFFEPPTGTNALLNAIQQGKPKGEDIAEIG
jgi:hypothetical protein